MTTPIPLEDINDPWSWETGDYQEKIIRITINWDTSNGALMSAVTYRDPECIYAKIYIGLSEAGIVEDTPDQWNVPVGETVIRADSLMKGRLRNIRDVLYLQITAGP